MSEVTAPPQQKSPPQQKPSPPQQQPPPAQKASPQQPQRSAPPRPRPSEGWGSSIANGLAAGTGALVRLTGKIFGEVRDRAGTSVAEFRARPEHSRWRAYALFGYGLIAAATFAGQLYTNHGINAYVRVQPVELPALTQIFVRNDSRQAWKNVRLTLNGIYTYNQNEVRPGLFILLPVNRFAVFDGSGKPTYAPKNIAPKMLAIDTADQHYETELRE